MNKLKDKIVIIGNGIAALSAIKAFREIDKESQVYLFGEEKYYPYNRMRLSKGLLSDLQEDKILLQKREWYDANNVLIDTDKKVTRVDVESKTVYFQDNNYEEYTKLLIATGADNFRPPIEGIEKEGVFTLRHLDDAKKIIKYEEKSKTVLHIGGGIQGLETAWVLSQAGKKVTIAELQPRLMPKQLDEKASKILQKAMVYNDIQVMVDTQINELVGKERVEAFRTKSGKELACDISLYAVGLEPNVACLKGTKIGVNKGIIVDKRMKTSVEDVYAAGDAAELDGLIYGLWNIAIEQGKVAGYNLAGKYAEYEHIVPVTTLNAFQMSLFSMGIIADEKATDFIVEEDEKHNKYSKIFINNHIVIGAIVIGDTKNSPVLKAAIEKQINLGELDYKNVSIDELIEIIRKNK
jgi:nitrite reductase (NADH) large subunit